MMLGGTVVAGRIQTGVCSVGEPLLLMPSGLACSIKSMLCNHIGIKAAVVGQNVEILLTGIDDPESTLFVGQMLCPPANPVPVANEIEIRIQTFPALSVPLIKGTELSCHHQSSEMVAVVSKLISQTPIAFASSASAMDEMKGSKKPRRIG